MVSKNPLYTRAVGHLISSWYRDTILSKFAVALR